MLSSVILAGMLVAAQDSIVLRLLTISDLHGSLETRAVDAATGRPVGGLPALKGTLDRLEAECACPVLRLDGGDQMQGSLASNVTWGRAAVEAMNLIGLDAAAIGNHDLDWGRDTLAVRVREARYPWLAANIVDSLTGRRPPWAGDWVIRQAGPFRVALVGYLLPGTKTIVLDRHVRGLHFLDPKPGLEAALAGVRAARPDFTILVTHEGGTCSEDRCAGGIFDLVRAFPPGTFDVVAAGHSHNLVNTVINGTPVVIPRSNGLAVGVIDLIAGADGTRRWTARVDTVWADNVIPDPAAQLLLDRIRPAVERLAGEVIFTLADSLNTIRGVEYPLGNLLADAQRAAARADVGLMNNGGIRRSLAPGPVTYADLFELQPFGNEIGSVEVTGRVLVEVLEHAIGSSGRPDGHISGVVVRFDPRRPRGERVVSVTRTDGTPIDPDGRYTLALTNFLAGGGGGFAMLRPLPFVASGLTDLEALSAWVRSLPSPVRAPDARRWVEVSR